MKLMKKDIRPNEVITTFFALEAMELRKSKAQKNFLSLDLYDRTGKLKGYLWNEPVIAAAMLIEKSFVKVRGIAKMINNSLIIEIEKIRKAEKNEIDMLDFLEVVSGGIELWHKKLIDVVGLIKDANCRRLIDLFLKDDGFLELFTTSPGGISVHHNYVGGLLEHTVNTMMQATLTADRNPGLLDKDLLLAGSFLHDIGKTREIYWEIAKEYTTEGKLLGYIGIGLLMLEEKLSEIKNFPEDLSVLLRHMILSHHGELEYGSLVRPATPEALALHLIENTDAKINHLYCHLGNSNPDKQWSHFDRFLNTEIYQKKFSKHIPKEIRAEAA
jgi:3'-5' exoribonuclease